MSHQEEPGLLATNPSRGSKDATENIAARGPGRHPGRAPGTALACPNPAEGEPTRPRDGRGRGVSSKSSSSGGDGPEPGQPAGRSGAGSRCRGRDGRGACSPAARRGPGKPGRAGGGREGPGRPRSPRAYSLTGAGGLAGWLAGFSPRPLAVAAAAAATGGSFPPPPPPPPSLPSPLRGRRRAPARAALPSASGARRPWGARWCPGAGGATLPGASVAAAVMAAAEGPDSPEIARGPPT